MLWKTEGQRRSEWSIAKSILISNGVMLHNGTKLSRKISGLQHSFLIVDGKILAMAGEKQYIQYTDKSCTGSNLKLAEDESGLSYVLKIDPLLTYSENEGQVAYDLSKSIHPVTRQSKQCIKHYTPYFYLGVSIRDYLANNPNLSNDKRYELAIKIALAFDDLHTGRSSRTGTFYAHCDINDGNIVYDEKKGIIALIDFASAKSINRFQMFRSLYHRFFTNTQRAQSPFLQSFPGDVSDDFQLEKILWPDGWYTSTVFSKNMEKPESLEKLLTFRRLSSDGTVIPQERSLLEVAKKLTLIRFKLDNISLYEEKLAPNVTRKMIKILNEHADFIHELYFLLNEIKEKEGVSDDFGDKFKLFLTEFVLNVSMLHIEERILKQRLDSIKNILEEKSSSTEKVANLKNMLNTFSVPSEQSGSFFCC